MKAVADRWLHLAQRVQPAAGLRSRHLDTAVRPDRAYAPVTARKPLFYIDSPAQTTLLSKFLDNPNLRPYVPQVVTLRGARVMAPSMVHRWHGVTLIEGLLDDASNLSYPRLVVDFECLPLRRAAQRRDGVLLALPLYANYYHWMLEMLPRLQLLDGHPELQSAPLLVPQALPGFARESLRLAGYLDRTEFLAPGAHRFQTLHVPSILSPPSHPAPLGVDWLRERLGTVRSGATHRKRRIYVSRRDASTRFVANEDEIEALLKAFGFETVTMSDHSLSAQITLFADAEMVVGIHGAALANLAFCDAGTYVLELFQEGWFTVAFYNLAMVRGLRYGYLLCAREGEALRVPMAELGQLLEQVSMHAKNSAAAVGTLARST